MASGDPVRVASVLGDPTRFSVYQHLVAAAPRPVSAQEVAELFGLHPNVARLHLKKLEEIGLVASRAQRSGKGGRPHRVYSLSGHALSINLPPRDYQLLSELLCQALALLGERGLEALEEVGRRHGREAARAVAGRVADEAASDPDLYLQAAARVLSEQGLLARVAPGRAGAVLTLHNCNFAEVAERFPELICRLCRGLVEGVLERQPGPPPGGAAGEPPGAAAVREEGSRTRGDACCSYVVEPA